MARRTPNPEFPLTVVIDTAEQLPYAFTGVPADKEFGGGVWRVNTARGSLVWGDYSLVGHVCRVAVERKSKADLFRTVGQERDRFVRELAGLDDYEFAAVVVEAEWSEVFGDPPRFSQLPPKLLYRNVLAWQQRYPRVHWWFVPGREVAEVTTFRILERFWKELEK